MVNSNTSQKGTTDFSRNNDLYGSSRLALLVRSDLLDSPIEEAFDRLTRLVAQATRSPVALVSLVSEERQFFKSAFGLPEPWASDRESPLTHSFCKHVVSTGEPLIVFDARIHSLVRENLAVRDMGVVAYAGIPLTLNSGETLGSFCIIDNRPRLWTREELDILTNLSKSVICEIELRLQMQSREDLLDLVFHDLKNPLGVIGLSSQLIRKRMPNSQELEFSQLNDKILRSVDRMSKIIQDVSDLIQIESGHLSLNRTFQSLEETVQAAHKTIAPFIHERGVHIETKVHQNESLFWDHVRIARVIANLLFVVLNFPKVGEQITLDVENNTEEVVVRISTQSPLIPREDIVHFFDRFWRSPNLSCKGQKLCLSIAQEVIQLHRGKTWTIANEGGHFTLGFSIPK